MDDLPQQRTNSQSTIFFAFLISDIFLFENNQFNYLESPSIIECVRKAKSGVVPADASNDNAHPPASLSATKEEDENAQTSVTGTKERWNHPPRNMWKVFAAFISFSVVGANDGSYGPLVPYIKENYHLSSTVVSLIFLSPFVGYMLAAVVNNKIHMTFGQRGIAVIAPWCHIVPFIIIAIHPPYPVVVIFYTVVGFGNGLIDSAWNAWIGDMIHSNEILGFLHGFYGLGATISPLIATAMITKCGVGWWNFYYVMLGAAVLELITAVFAFWNEDATSFREKNKKTTDENRGRLKESLQNRVSWICSAFLFAYVGVEVTLGGWIVVFMIQARGGRPFESGVVPTGFWLGITIGRITLGFVTGRVGERVAIAGYLIISIALQLIFWLVPRFIVSAIAVSFLGFFLGPLFPGAIAISTKLLPKHLHTSSVGFSSAFGGGGAAVLPFVAGAINSAKGVTTLQPFVLALLAACFISWLMLPRARKHPHDA